MFKKTWFILSGLLVIALILTACQPPATPAAPAEPQVVEVTRIVQGTPETIIITAKPEPTSMPAASGETVRINLAIQGEDRNELGLYNELARKCEEANPNIDINVDWLPWDAFETKIKTGFAADNPPDVFWLWINNMPFFSTRGKLLDLTPYIERDNFSLDNFYKTTMDAYRYNDGVYAIPRETSTVVLYYNKDLFDEAGVPYPDENWTFQTYQEAAQKLTKKDAAGNITQFGSSTLGDPFKLWGLIWSNGGDVMDETKLKCAMNTPETIEAIQWVADLSNVHHVAPTAGESAGMSEEQLFLSGKVAMFLSGRWSTLTLWNAENAPRWDIAPIPAASKELRKTRTSAGSHAIAAETKNPDEAWEVVKCLSSEEAFKFFTELGVIIPAYIPVAELQTFLPLGKDPEHGQAFLDAMSYAKFEPIGENYPKVSDVLWPGLQPVWDGTKTAAEVIPDLCPKLEAAAAGQ